MEDEKTLRKCLIELFQSQLFAVFTSNDNGQPYPTLVAFIEANNLKSILFATDTASRKYKNVINNPRVAMLIDNRSNDINDLKNATTVSVIGKTREIKDKNNSSYLSLYLKKHSNLSEFVKAPTTALLEIQVERYIIVRQFQNAVELNV